MNRYTKCVKCSKRIDTSLEPVFHKSYDNDENDEGNKGAGEQQ